MGGRSSSQAIVVFGRDPRAEAAAKRLPIALARLFGVQAARAARAVPAADLLFAGGTPGGSLAAPVDRRLEQRGDGLGERLHHAFIDAFALGYERVAIVAADVPEIDSAVMARAFDLLGEQPGTAVLGPSPDGGFYLVALAALPASVRAIDWQQGIPWFTCQARQGLADALGRAGFEVAELEAIDDIDDVAAARRLTVRLAAGRNPDFAFRHLVLCALSSIFAATGPAAHPRTSHSISPCAGRAPPVSPPPF